jgi:hypothetical protein
LETSTAARPASPTRRAIAQRGRELLLAAALALLASACSKENTGPTAAPPTQPAQVDHERMLQADRLVSGNAE